MKLKDLYCISQFEQSINVYARVFIFGIKSDVFVATYNKDDKELDIDSDVANAEVLYFNSVYTNIIDVYLRKENI